MGFSRCLLSYVFTLVPSVMKELFEVYTTSLPSVIHENTHTHTQPWSFYLNAIEWTRQNKSLAFQPTRLDLRNLLLLSVCSYDVIINQRFFIKCYVTLHVGLVHVVVQKEFVLKHLKCSHQKNCQVYHIDNFDFCFAASFCFLPLELLNCSYNFLGLCQTNKSHGVNFKTITKGNTGFFFFGLCFASCLMRLMAIQVVDSGEEKLNKQAFHSDLAAVWFWHRHSIKQVPAKIWSI